MSVSPDVARVLRDAADLIERRGHCKRTFWDDDGRHCIIGAIYTAADDGRWSWTRATIELVKDATGGDPYHWNDAPERTRADVVAKLREVAAS